MHELTITEHILQRVLSWAQSNHASRVTAIRLTVGELTGYVDDSIELYWKEIAVNTIASEASVFISRKPATLKCTTCSSLYTDATHYERCPGCGSFKLVIVSGDQLEIESIEIETV